MKPTAGIDAHLATEEAVEEGACTYANPSMAGKPVLVVIVVTKCTKPQQIVYNMIPSMTKLVLVER